jgi:hypothetical protein
VIGQTQTVRGQSISAARIEAKKFFRTSTRCEGNFVDLTVVKQITGQKRQLIKKFRNFSAK